MGEHGDSELAERLESSNSLIDLIWIIIRALIFLICFEFVSYMLTLCTTKKVLGGKVLLLDLTIDTLLCCAFLRRKK